MKMLVSVITLAAIVAFLAFLAARFIEQTPASIAAALPL